jgi:hypothetical protein
MASSGNGLTTRPSLVQSKDEQRLATYNQNSKSAGTNAQTAADFTPRFMSDTEVRP